MFTEFFVMHSKLFNLKFQSLTFLKPSNFLVRKKNCGRIKWIKIFFQMKRNFAATLSSYFFHIVKV